MTELSIYKIDKILEIKALVATSHYYEHIVINNRPIFSDTISIVMTSSNRSKQTYYTLKSLMNSAFKNIHVILVDDSDIDPITIETLESYPFYIDFVKIKKNNKTWKNPCVNYNIGFLFVKGEQVIIQNAEVCHVGDVLNHVHETVNKENYYVFDVQQSLDYNTNEILYKKDIIDINYFSGAGEWRLWYQHAKHHNRKLHFLSAMNFKVFKKIGGFSYDYSFGSGYDDDDFVLKINSLNIPIVTLSNEESMCGGIHLFHTLSTDKNQWAETFHKDGNNILFKVKQSYYNKTLCYIEITANKETASSKLIALGIKKPVVVTITGIRPDFIRMSSTFKALDENFTHILIHTGQHYDALLSDIFFQDLEIRKPDYVLETGISSTNHYEQLSYLSSAVPKLLKEKNIQPDLILFLGDSNSAAVSLPLKKDGYRIGHIDAGMRSYDKRMLEELNRTVCDHCSDILFVYHEDYKQQLALENITKNVHVVGNTIIEPLMMFKDTITVCEKRKDMILLDVHRPENFNYLPRLISIFTFANACSEKYGLPVKMLYFKRLNDMIVKYSLDIGKIEMVPLMPYKKYLDTVYHCRFIISDSGTGQEEPAMLGTPVVVPREFTERPQSVTNNCSIMFKESYDDVFQWISDVESGVKKMNTEWLGDGKTSKKIIEHLKAFFTI